MKQVCKILKGIGETENEREEEWGNRGAGESEDTHHFAHSPHRRFIFSLVTVSINLFCNSKFF